jgi:hypothetical protein
VRTRSGYYATPDQGIPAEQRTTSLQNK